MKHTILPGLSAALVCLGAATGQADIGKAQPYEVVAKVRQAAALLTEYGASGLAVIRDTSSPFTWKDSYVFVVDCDADLVLANPAFPARQGGDIKQHKDYDGKQYGRALCRTAKQPGGGWVQYVWPSPDGGAPTRKISYVMSVQGRSYQVGAGIYDDTTTAQELSELPFAPN